MNGRSYVLRMFLVILSPSHFSRRLQTDIFETSPYDVALLEKRSAAMLLNHYISAAVSHLDTIWQGYAVRPS